MDCALQRRPSYCSRLRIEQIPGGAKARWPGRPGEAPLTIRISLEKQHDRKADLPERNRECTAALLAAAALAGIATEKGVERIAT